jgi:hypothetical protein
MMFLTAHPSLSLSSRNVVPYYELPVYKTVQSKKLEPRTLAVGTTVFNKPSETSGIMSSNIQLNQVPDKLIICCRRVISRLDCTYADNCLSISNVNINFNGIFTSKDAGKHCNTMLSEDIGRGASSTSTFCGHNL